MWWCVVAGVVVCVGWCICGLRVMVCVIMCVYDGICDDACDGVCDGECV